jgi:glutathionylspermidine synthase
MERVQIQPRPDWREQVEQWGLLFHDNRNERPNDNPDYWNEAAYYWFTADEVDTLESTTNELHEMCLSAVQHVIDTKRYPELAIPPSAIDLIEQTWSHMAPSIYGRFDLGFDGFNPPKLLEYNADTPIALLEAAVVQWKWLEDRFPDSDQFNSIWEGLVEKWTQLKSDRSLKGSLVHFGHLDSIEDSMTVAVLRDTAHEAGVLTEAIWMQEIGWDHGRRLFVDLENRPIRTMFKLYP